jgi:hypothetical protein
MCKPVGAGSGVSPYALGWKRCSTCDVWVLTEEVVHDLCGKRMRCGPNDKLSHEKLLRRKRVE